MDDDRAIVLPPPRRTADRVLQTSSRGAGAPPMQTGMDIRPLPDGPRPTHCPQCSAVARGDVPWCLVCYAPFAADEGAPPDPDGPPARDGRSTPETDPTRPTPPNRLRDVDAVADLLLAELAATANRPTWSRRLPGTRAGRAVLATGLLAGSSGALLAVMSLLGHLI